MMKLTDSLLRSAMASKLAYAKSTNLISTFPVSRLLLPENNTFEVIDCSHTGAHAYVWKTGRRATMIAFRGSHDITDICSYINSSVTPFSFCDKRVQVHNRIYSMFSSIEPWISAQLHPRQHVTFCGHSLGGAIAMFAAAYYSHLSNRNMNITCHTFGVPKVGDAAFVEWFTEYVPDHVNVRNKWDVVTYYPFDATYSGSITNSVVFDSNWGHDLDTYIENIVDGLTRR